MSTNALAQSAVNARASDHAEYSRLVFNWSNRVPYTLKKSSNMRYEIRFEKNSSLGRDISRQTYRNIRKIQQTSSAPLTLTFETHAGSRVRDFYIDNRLVVDAFNDPTGKSFSSERSNAASVARTLSSFSPILLKPKVKPTPTQEVAALEPAPPSKEEHSSEITPLEAPPKTETDEKPQETEIEKAPQEQKIEEEINEPPETALDEAIELHSEKAVNLPTFEPEPPKERSLKPTLADKLKTSAADLPTLIRLAMPKATSVAAFRLYDRLWLVHNNRESHAPPKVTGPLKEELSNLQSFSGDAGLVYITPDSLPETLKIKGKGGGSLWEFSINPNLALEDTRAPISPIIMADKAQDTETSMIEIRMSNASNKAKIIDPETGWPIHVITAKDANNFVHERYEYVDFSLLPSPAGVAIQPKVDDLNITVDAKGIKIYRDGGLNVSKGMKRRTDLINITNTPRFIDSINDSRIFEFNKWAVTDYNTLKAYHINTLENIRTLSKFRQSETIKNLAEVYLSEARASEALGLLNLAISTNEDIATQPKFKALFGAADTLAGNSRKAYNELSDQALNPYSEIDYWKAVALAEIGNWEDAYKTLPRSLNILKTYPAALFNRIAGTIVEIYLRAGKPSVAGNFLKDMEANKETLKPEQLHTLLYLQGEYARQKGDTETVKEKWYPLLNIDNKMYRARATLALTRFLYEEKEIEAKRAIDNLERVRYDWRDDSLEINILYWLGKYYVDDKNFTRALTILRYAAAQTEEQDFADQITQDMKQIFSNVFLRDKLKDTTPLEALTLYEQFSELIPNTSEANDVINILASHLANANLLSRAINLLKYQFDHRLSGIDAVKIGKKLTGLYLLDSNPQQAKLTIENVEKIYNALPSNERDSVISEELTLLKVRTLSEIGDKNEALFILDRMEDSAQVNRLRADLAWQGGYWEDAADALKKIIEYEKLAVARSLNKEQIDLVLRYAVALNLANDRIGIADLREGYSELMKRNQDTGKTFELITRARRAPGLSDRQTLLNVVSETDLFGSFLENYKN